MAWKSRSCEPTLTERDDFQFLFHRKVRGAPAIAIVGCLSLAVEISSLHFTKESLYEMLKQKLDYLLTSRPTAVNLKVAANQLKGRPWNPEIETRAKVSSTRELWRGMYCPYVSRHQARLFRNPHHDTLVTSSRLLLATDRRYMYSWTLHVLISSRKVF